MKTSLLLFIANVFLLGCSNKTKVSDSQPQIITYDSVEKNSIIESNLIDSITIVPLQTTSECLLGPNPELYEYKNDYFVIDKFGTQKIYRFDNNGKFINSIGELGSGPNEYIEMSDFSISPDNMAIIICRQTKCIYKYNIDGRFISKQESRLPLSQGLVDNQNNMWIYLGYANVVDRGRIAKIDLEGNLILDTLESKFNVMTIDEITPVFSTFDNKIFVRESMNNIVYKVEDKTVTPLYKFDFGKYNIPEEYWKKANYQESMDMLMTLDFVVVRRYMENANYSIVEAQIQQKSDPKLLIVHGIQNKITKTWLWYNSDISEVDNKVLIKSIHRLTDENEMLCIVSPDLIKQYYGFSKINNPEIINQINDDDNYVIVRCKLQ